MASAFREFLFGAVKQVNAFSFVLSVSVIR